MRLTHLADYAVVMMTAAARREPARARLSAAELAAETGVPLPTAQKLMGKLAVRGTADQRARARRRIYAGPPGNRNQPRRHRRSGRRADRADAMCSDGMNHDCVLDAHCRVKPHMGIVGAEVRGALGAVTLQELAQ